jgi:hypothetical protein
VEKEVVWAVVLVLEAVVLLPLLVPLGPRAVTATHCYYLQKAMLPNVKLRLLISVAVWCLLQQEQCFS